MDVESMIARGVLLLPVAALLLIPFVPIVDARTQPDLHEQDVAVINEVDEPVEIAEVHAHSWTRQDEIKLAKLVWCEAGIVEDTAQQAAVIWCVLNRLEDGSWGDTISEVVTAPYQFAYDPEAPLKLHCVNLVDDVLARWESEQHGGESVGRTLPKEYIYFGSQGGVNYFRTEYDNFENIWDWRLPDPYKERKEI